MNYYDLSAPAVLTTKGYKKGLFQKRAAILYKSAIYLCAVITVALILLSTRRSDYSAAMLKYCLIIFIAFVIFAALMHGAAILISAKTAEKFSLADRHDYNYALYSTKYRKNQKLQSVCLLQMAKQQLLMGSSDMALQALSLTVKDSLSLANLRSFYFYKAAALYLGGQTGWEECLNSCYSIPAQRNQLSNEKIAAAFSSDILQAVKNENQEKKKWPAAMIISAVVILYAGFFYGIEGLLLPGYSYRYGFRMSSIVFISISVMALSLYWIVKFILFRNKTTGKTTASGILKNILLGIAWFCLAAALLLYQFVIFITMDTEVTVYENGIICLMHSEGYSANEYYYNMKAGPFLRRSLTSEERDKYKSYISDSYSADYTDLDDDTNSDTYSGSDDDTNSDTYSDSDGYTSDYAYTDDITLFSESQAVYQYLADEGLVTDTDITQLKHGFTAKGTFYTIFESDETDGKSYENRLVYDRTSANGECELFVYQRVSDSSDTQLLGFYAVNKETNQVISADKTSWGGVSSDAYKEATGED